MKGEGTTLIVVASALEALSSIWHFSAFTACIVGALGLQLALLFIQLALPLDLQLALLLFQLTDLGFECLLFLDDHFVFMP